LPDPQHENLIAISFRGKRCHKYIGKKAKGRHHHVESGKSEDDSTARGAAVFFPHLAAGKNSDYKKYEYNLKN
jgi:hypothetical protein